MKKVTLETVKKRSLPRVGLHSNMYSKSIAPHCFICDEEIIGRGVPLLVSHTSYTKTGLPSKIGQLMGEGFMVVVSIEDMLCKRCGALLNHLDKLESDLDIVKRALTGYLKMKYGLLDEEQIAPEVYVSAGQENTEETSPEIADVVAPDLECLVSEDSHESDSETEFLQDVNPNRTIEILLDEVPSASKDQLQTQKKDQSSEQNSVNMYKCSNCNFRSWDSSIFHSHFLSCCELPFKCTMCEKKFESQKYVRKHIMEAHLSNWTCHFCNKSFSEEKDFTSHMKTHLGHKNNASKMQLEESFSASGSEDASCESLNLLGNFECNICDYQCSSKKVFDDHVRKHVVLKLFQCKDCNKRFEHKEALTEHTKEHKAESVKCQFCPEEFETKDSLIEHQQMHRVLLVPEADVTEDSVVEKMDLPANVTDDSSKPVSNEMEVSNFIIGNELKADEKQTGENVRTEIEFHTCHVCSLTFVNESRFTEHMKMHKQVEPGKELFCQNTSQLLQIDKVNLDDDSTEHDVNSIDSEGRQQYVEMDESLDDMFEKLHAESDKVGDVASVIESNEKNESNHEIQAQSGIIVHKCNTCHEEFINDDELQLHKVTQMHLENDTTCDSNKVVLMENKLEVLTPCSDSSKIEEKLANKKSDNHNLCEDSTLISHNESVIEGSSKGFISSQIEVNEKDNFVDIFDMVREKKLSSNDNAAIDHNLLQKMCEVKTEDMEIPLTPTLDLFQYASTDVNLSEGELYSTAPIPGQSKKTYVCAMCGYRTPAMFDLKRHFKEHKQKSFQCKICNKILPTSQKLSAHVRCHERFRGKMTCPYCYGEFPDRGSLQQHLQDKHQKEKVMYKCSFCNETFNTKKAYKAHEEVHPERFSFKCDECDQHFLKEKQLVDHKDACHRDPHCRFCGKEIMKAKTLRNHELRHIREKDNFECDICKRVFKTKTGLRHHVAVHTGEYKYCCDYCGRGFMSRMMMEEHRSMHTKEERYICDVCGRKFSFQSTYWIHRKWHDNPYPYKCTFCGRMFRHSSLLAVHKRKHTGERPYKCPHCPLTFPVGGTLKRHLILHTGVYPFNCESCKRGFTTRHKYATHLAKIHGDFEMLHAKPQQSEFKMVVRDDPKPVQQPSVWEVADDSVTDQMNFKLEAITGEDDGSKDQVGEGIACTIVSDDMLVDNMVPTRVVEIVLDETSQAVATVTLAEHTSILPDIWYQ